MAVEIGFERNAEDIDRTSGAAEEEVDIDGLGGRVKVLGPAGDLVTSDFFEATTRRILADTAGVRCEGTDFPAGARCDFDPALVVALGEVACGKADGMGFGDVFGAGDAEDGDAAGGRDACGGAVCAESTTVAFAELSIVALADLAIGEAEVDLALGGAEDEDAAGTEGVADAFGAKGGAVACRDRAVFARA